MSRLLLIILFFVVPLTEIYFLIEVGQVIGSFWTIFLVVLTAVVGAVLLRYQGFYTLRQAQAAMERGEMPAIPMLEGVLLLASGLLLMTPGFFTDGLGFLLLVPPLRQALIRYALRHFIHLPPPGSPPSGDTRGGRRPTIIDGEYDREDD